MDFARFSFSHASARNSYRVRNENELFDCPEIDSMKMNFLPQSFFHLLKVSYNFTDPYVAMSIVPDQFDLENKKNSLLVNLAAAGFVYRNPNELHASIMSHYAFATKYCKSDDVDEFLSDHSIDTLSFVSPQLSKIYKFFHKKEKNFILLFYTPVGFAIYRPSLVDMNEAHNIGIVLSKKDILNCDIENFSIRLCTPSAANFQATRDNQAISFCDFTLIQGTWQPKLNLNIVSRIFTYINYKYSSTRDCCTINFSAFSGMSYRVVGLIGRYSDILKLFTPKNSEIENSFVKQLHGMNKYLNPQMYYIKTERAVSYVILYLPDDFMPNHPHYKEVTEYAYTFMRRACTITLFVPNTEIKPPKYQIFNHIQGLINQANSAELLFFGSGKSQIISHCQQITSNSLEFDDLSDFVSWMSWVSPFYAFDFSSVDFQISKDGISFDKNTLLNLIENEVLLRSGNRHFIDTILYGVYEHKSPEEIADMILKSKEQDKDIGKLINNAVYLAKIAADMRRNQKCAVCHMRNYASMTEEQKIQERTNHDLNELCPWCCLKKLKVQDKENTPEAKNYSNFIKSYDSKLSSFNKELKIFTDILIKKAKPSSKTVEKDPYIEIDPIYEFVIWFFEYWCIYNLESDWDELKEGNILQIDNFDDVERDENGHVTEETKQCINKLTGDHFYIENEIKDVDIYLQKLITISKMYGHLVDSNDIFEGFQAFLTKKIANLINAVQPLPYSYFQRKYEERLKQLEKKYIKHDINKNYPNKKDNPNIAFKSIMATYKMTLDVVVDNNNNYLDFKDYTFNTVNQLAHEKFSTKQLQCEKAVYLKQQPFHLKIINSWRVNIGVLALVAIGNKARLIFLPQNFDGKFVDNYLYETTINDSDHCYASFAPLPYTLCIVSDSEEDKDRFIALIQVSLDFSSAVEVKRRPLECLLPIPSARETRNMATDLLLEEEEDDNDDDDDDTSKKKSKKKHSKKKKDKKKKTEEIVKVKTSFDGFIIDETATYGALGATIYFGKPNIQPINFLIEFNPSKLSIKKVHRLIFSNCPRFPVCPLHFYKLPQQKEEKGDQNSEQKQNNNEQHPQPQKPQVERNDELYDSIICISQIPDFTQPQYILVYSEKSVNIIQITLDGLGDSIANKIGVSDYEGDNILVFARKNQPPTLQSASDELPKFPDWLDMFNPNFDFLSVPEFVAGCNLKYGYSEIERVFFPTHIPYPIELVKFEVLNTLDGPEVKAQNAELFRGIKSAMANVVPLKDGWSVPFRIYKKGNLTNSNELDLADLFYGKNNYDAVINFLTRLVSIPQIFVGSIPRPPAEAERYLINSIISMSVRFMSKFPPLPLLRGSYERKCMTISLVDIGTNADGSSIISSISGVPFTKLLPGSVNVGVNYIPIFNSDQKTFPLFEPELLKSKISVIRGKSVVGFNNVIACHFKPDRCGLVASNFVTLFCAMKCSDIVIINAGNQTHFLIDVLKFFIELVSKFDGNYKKLFDDDTKSNNNDDDDDDDNDDENENDDNDDDTESIFPILKGIAFVTELGNDPLAKIHEIELKLSKALTFRDKATTDIFSGRNTFVPSEYSTFEIARSIANEQLLNNRHLKNLRQTNEAYKSLTKYCGNFGSILSHIDFMMYTDRDTDEEAPQNESDAISDDSDEDMEEEEEAANDD